MYYAHSTSRPDRRDWQRLNDHLVGVADGAERRGEALGIGMAARLAGVLHDLGKYTPAFQRRLTGDPSRVDHSTAGAAMVLALAKAPNDKHVAELIAHAIAGHHAGLPDRIGADGSLDARLEAYSADALDPVWREEISPLVDRLLPPVRLGIIDDATIPLCGAGPDDLLMPRGCGLSGYGNLPQTLPVRRSHHTASLR